MANELQSLSELFQKRLFRIPDYQRGFAWTQEQLTDFWDDIVNLHDDRYHYTGLLSLKAADDNYGLTWQEDNWLVENGYKPFYVVDGQQRLTTFSILLFEILSLVRNLPEQKDKSEEEIFLNFESLKDIRSQFILRKRPPENLVTTYVFGYETDNPSSDYLKHKVFMEPYGGTVIETYYTKNLKFAKSFFAENLSAIKKAEGLFGVERIYKKLTQRLMFNLHEIEDDYDVFVAFETMNNRGKKLTNLELLKNRLIYLTTLFDDQQLDTADQTQLRKDINNTWKEVYYQLGRNQRTPLSDDEFLRGHWITYYQYTRRRGDDYIRFLLNKFSAKNVFEKTTIVLQNNGDEPIPEFDELADEDFSEEFQEIETITISKLSPKEISNYVNSLKDMAEPWYYSFFPEQSPTLTDAEKIWIDKLTRIGIGYFRPLVVAMLLTAKQTTLKERIAFLVAIERFIFLAFRVGRFNASYKSSDYYRKSRDLLQNEITLSEITADLNNTIESDMNNLIANFISHTDRRFNKGDGFYTWRELKYFMYEYEYQLSVIKNIKKVDWSMFTRVEKDKVTIEHILPQTPTDWYWRNQFRQFNDNEMKMLTGSLGNLLPLAQSINSSLQNDSFHHKKNPKSRRRRGYTDGSHSEIEVSAYEDWDAQKILDRGLGLLEFMSKRWGVPFTEEQKMDLLHIGFVNDGRPSKPELLPEPDPENSSGSSLFETKKDWTEERFKKFEFWKRFVEYCRLNGRAEDIAVRKPRSDGWYDVPIGCREYYVFFQILGKQRLLIGLYVLQPKAFARLEALKSEIETIFGSEFDWYKSAESSKAKRIVHSIQADVYNSQLYPRHFDWLISHFDKLVEALQKCDTDASLVRDRNLLTTDMTAIAFDISKKVYEGVCDRAKGINEIVRLSGMNAASAGDYIQGFLAMMNGERYTRTLNVNATKYYLQHILEDYGEDALQKAIESCKLHAEYYASLGNGRLFYVERLVEEYSNL